jgi:HD-like signal output (HDOD) protein
VVADAERELARIHLASERTANGLAMASLPDILEELHTGVGLRIAELWNLPRPVVNAIGTYANYDSVPGAPQGPLITCLADRLATDLTEPGRFDEESVRDHKVFGHLNLYPDDVAGLRAKRTRVAEAVESMTV